MKCLERNKVPLYYANYVGKTPLVDENGNKTGEYVVTYSTPTLLRANVSSANGEAQTEQFGTSVQYDRFIISDQMDLDITENSILFIDVPVSYDSEGNPLNDYIVKKVARTLTHISFACTRVEVS